MQRRGFLKLLGLGAAAAATGALVDVERELWVPGQRTHFVPPVGGWKIGDSKLARQYVEGMSEPMKYDHWFTDPAVFSPFDWHTMSLNYFEREFEIPQRIRDAKMLRDTAVRYLNDWEASRMDTVLIGPPGGPYERLGSLDAIGDKYRELITNINKHIEEEVGKLMFAAAGYANDDAIHAMKYALQMRIHQPRRLGGITDVGA